MGAQEAWNKKLGTCISCGASIVMKKEMEAAGFADAGWQAYNAGSDTRDYCLKPRVRQLSREEMEKLYPPQKVKS